MRSLCGTIQDTCRSGWQAAQHSALLHVGVLPDQQHLVLVLHRTAIVSLLAQDALHGLQPTPHFEDVETKRRLNNIIHYSGLIDKVQQLKARSATKAELCLVHTPEYVQYVQVGSSCSCQPSTSNCHQS